MLSSNQNYFISYTSHVDAEINAHCNQIIIYHIYFMPILRLNVKMMS